MSRWIFNSGRLKIHHDIRLGKIRFLPGVLKAGRAGREFVVPCRQVPGHESSGASGRRHHTSGGNRSTGYGAPLRIGNHARNRRPQRGV